MSDVNLQTDFNGRDLLCKKKKSHTLSQHPHCAALPQPAVLALPPHVHVHLTATAALALVHGLLGDAPPEET